MKEKIIATVRMTYGTRRLMAGDVFDASRRDARLLVAIGKARPADVEVKPAKIPPHNDIAMLRAEYERVVGRKPFMGWDEAMLRAKITEAKG